MKGYLEKLVLLFGMGRHPGGDDPAVIRHAECEIIRTNIKRSVLLIWLLVIFEIFIVVFYDLVGNITTTSVTYLVIHISIMAVGLTAFVLLRLSSGSRRYSGRTKLRFYRLLIVLTPMSVMTLLAFISVLDQSSTGSISAFTVNIIIVAVLILVKPPTNLVMFTLPYAVFLAGVILNQPYRALMANNLINGSVFYICVLAISTFFYYSYRNGVIGNHLLKKAKNKLKEISSIDSLTGLYNRRYLESILVRELSYMKRYDEKCSLILIDIDHFKEVNDTFGHPDGDSVLVEFASILKDSIRESDLAVRMGGEEFLLLMFKSEMKSVIPKAGEILDEIRNHVFLEESGKGFRLTASIGISELSGYTMDDYNASYRKADKAMYNAKQKGRNRIEVS